MVCVCWCVCHLETSRMKRLSAIWVIVRPKSHSSDVERLKDTEIKSSPRIACLQSEIKFRVLPIL